jgi:hypothetical protein
MDDEAMVLTGKILRDFAKDFLLEKNFWIDFG